MTALVLGTLLAIAALAFVLWPLFDERAGRAMAPARRRATGPEPEPGAIDALREIEFDRATGKLSDTDYDALKATYTRAALSELRAGEQPADADVAVADPAEAAVMRWRAGRRSCAKCGPRPEPDAVYCSDCGSWLDGKCPDCSAPVVGAGRVFCTECGRRLSAG